MKQRKRNLSHGLNISRCARKLADIDICSKVMLRELKNCLLSSFMCESEKQAAIKRLTSAFYFKNSSLSMQFERVATVKHYDFFLLFFLIKMYVTRDTLLEKKTNI